MRTALLSPPNKPPEIILWVGAGVSFPNPTALPLGRTLTEFALDHTLGVASRTQLFELWDRLNAFIDETKQGAPLGSIPRLETVLGSISDGQASVSGGSYDFLKGFETFADAEPNENHNYLAELLSAGASVVTTNFDLCVEKCLRTRLPGSAKLRTTRHGLTHQCRVSGHSGYGTIWHLHGIASRPQDLGATIKAIKTGLPSSFTKELEAHLHRGCHVVFLGYSGTDAFDVTLYFKSFKPAHFPRSSATFVQHATAKPPNGIRAFLRCFGSSTVVSASTEDFLRTLSGISSPLKCGPTLDWKKGFLAKSVMSAPGGATSIVSCAICNDLGIRADVVRAGTLASAKRYFAGSPGKVDDILAVAFRLAGQAKGERAHTTDAARLVGYYYAHGLVERALELTRPASVLLNAVLSAPPDLDWGLYTESAVRCRAIILRHLRNGVANPLGSSDLNELEILIRVFSVLSDRSLAQVRNVQAVATAYRFRMLIHAYIDGVDDLASQELVTSLYGDLGSVSGYIGTYRDIAIKNLVLSTRGRRDNRVSDARYFAQKSVSLARCAGDVLGERHGLTLIDLMP